MCKEKKTKQTTVQSVPGYVEDASKKVTQKATELSDKPYEAYTGDRVAGFTGDQENAFQMLRDYISGSPNLLPGAIEGAQSYASAPAQQISTERVVDEGGRLGEIGDYLNPYADKALDPVIRRITEAAEKQRIALGNRATTAGAYGDQRHGVVESELNQDFGQAVGDTASKFYMDAFDKAMGLRTGDLNRFYNTDVANANFDEQALSRMLTGSGATLDMQAKDQQTMLNQLGALLGHGTLQQGVNQADLDAAYQEFQREYQHSFDVIQALSSALSGLPFTRTSTTTGKTPDNSLLGLAGAIGGSVLGGPMGASLGSSLFGGGGAMVGPTMVDPTLPWLQ